MKPEDIGLLAVAGDVAITPDGRRVAYTLTTQDLGANKARTRLWLVDTDGASRPRPLTAGDSDHLPRWSPDGSLLAWVAADDERTTIRVQAVDGPGEAVIVCEWPDDVSELEWAPGGDRLAFVGRVPDPARYAKPGETRRPADVPPRRITRLYSRLDGEGWLVDRPTHLHVVPIDGSAAPQRLTTTEQRVEGLAWSPDGTRLAYVAANHDDWDLDNCTDLWVVGAAGEEREQLTDTTVGWYHPSWSPDGTRLAALVERTPMVQPVHGQVWVLPIGDRVPRRWGSDIDRNLAPYPSAREPVWIGDEALLAGMEDEGRVSVVALGDPGGGDHGKTRTVVGGDRVVRSYDVAGRQVAFSASTVAEPGEVWVADLDSEEERRLTDHGATLRSRVRLVVPERYTARSTDGVEVECWAMAPPAASAESPCPTVLNIHGGPFTQYGWGFFDEFQLQVGAGLGVVYCNPRGSAGYSEAWGRAVRWPEAKVDPGTGWGGVDFDDVIACVDEATRRFAWVDASRLGVQGGSYGGYMTSWIVGHTRRFKAAVSERAANDLLTLEHDSDIAGSFRDYVGWTYVDRPELYVRQSPSTYVKEMHTPMLLLHSEEDLRCPISQAEELFVALRLLGRNPELVRFPGEGHELSRSGAPRHRVQRAEIILDWFERHLVVP